MKFVHHHPLSYDFKLYDLNSNFSNTICEKVQLKIRNTVHNNISFPIWHILRRSPDSVRSFVRQQCKNSF